MSVKAFLGSKAGQFAILGVVGVGVYLFLKREVVNTAKAAGGAVNPVSDKNIFYKSVNAVGDVLDDGTKNGGFSLGSWIGDWFPSAAEKEFTASQTSSIGAQKGIRQGEGSASLPLGAPRVKTGTRAAS